MIAIGDAAFNALKFTLTLKDADKCSYICTKASEAVPAAATIIAEGQSVSASGVVEIAGLEPNTAYRLSAVALKGNINGKVSYLQMPTAPRSLSSGIVYKTGMPDDAKAKIAVLGKLRAALDEGKAARTVALDDEEKLAIRELFLLTMKPVMYVANVMEDGFENNPHLDAVRARAQTEGAKVVPVCAAIEEELSQLDDVDRDAFLTDLGLEEPGLNRVIRAAYELLGLQTYFTAGVKEVRAWTVKAGSTAPQAAAVIHTDFEKGFIRAETIGYDDFIKYRGEAGARDVGRLRLEGKEYRVQEGDVLHFRFNV